MFFGVGMFAIADVLSGSGRIPVASTRCPNNFIDDLRNWHLLFDSVWHQQLGFAEVLVPVLRHAPEHLFQILTLSI